jgi:DNA-directed RNA polymerase subunit E'
MFYKLKLKDHIRVPPYLFGESVEDSIMKAVKKVFNNFVSQELGVVIDIIGIEKIYDGTIIPGDGASYYESEFELLVFKPEMQEVIPGKVRDVADFGVFMNMGPIDGMIHVSQTMDDYVSFSKDKTLLGKESKKSLKVGDKCHARIIAVSFKESGIPKIGLTMRQQGLGRTDWISEEFVDKKKVVKESKDKK